MIGGLLGHSVQDTPEPANCGQLICDLDFKPSETATGALIGALAGGGLGYLFGKQMGADKWDAIDLGRMRAGLLRSPSGAGGLGLAASF